MTYAIWKRNFIKNPEHSLYINDLDPFFGGQLRHMTEQYNRMRHGELLGTPLTAKKVLDGRQKNRYHTTCDNAEPADKKRAFSFVA